MKRVESEAYVNDDVERRGSTQVHGDGRQHARTASRERHVGREQVYLPTFGPWSGTARSGDRWGLVAFRLRRPRASRMSKATTLG